METLELHVRRGDGLQPRQRVGDGTAGQHDLSCVAAEHDEVRRERGVYRLPREPQSIESTNSLASIGTMVSAPLHAAGNR